MSLPNSILGFKATLDGQEPQSTWPLPLQALWWDAKGDWHKAHGLVDGAVVPLANRVHAYLHRKEGDEWNAAYWYQRAGTPFFKKGLHEEWEQLINSCLGLSPNF